MAPEDVDGFGGEKEKLGSRFWKAVDVPMVATMEVIARRVRTMVGVCRRKSSSSVRV